MNYRIVGDSDNPYVAVSLPTGQRIKLESGSMMYMQGVTIEGKLNANSKGLGGLFKAVARSAVSGESMFITEAEGTAPDGRIGIAPSVPGCIRKLTIGDRQYRLNTGAFLCCDDSVTYNMIAQKSLGKAVFGGTGGFFIMETAGYGDLFVNAFGDMEELEVTEGNPLTIDNEHVIAWDSNLDYNIRVASGVIGFTSGEGLVNEFHGNGKILIQTRNVHSLAKAVQPYLPSQSS